MKVYIAVSIETGAAGHGNSGWEETVLANYDDGERMPAFRCRGDAEAALAEKGHLWSPHKVIELEVKE